MPRVLPALFIGCLLALVGLATEPDTSRVDVEFFEARIRPILVGECYECHGVDKQRGGLRVDSLPALLEGGDLGPSLIPGDAENSPLWQSIAHTHPELAMPHKRPKLTDRVVADFALWIRAGAPDPRATPPETHAEPGSELDAEALWDARSSWWSFQPVQSPRPPEFPGSEKGTHPVDRFIQQRLLDAGIPSADLAEPEVQIRRLAYTLTGLPPDPESVRCFVQDPSPAAFERWVDTYLASPHFGEHWARHWMDLFRYAETHGSEGDPEIPDAWQYRDYLIRAFNQDVPIDQLIREHIAGDLLHPQRVNPDLGIRESPLGLIHYRLVEHGFQPVDTLDEQIRTVDNQIDVLTKAFQGLTVSCARCHDHKFDPIRQSDYFAMHGVVASCLPARITVDTPERLRQSIEPLTELKQTLRSKLADAWAEEVVSLGKTLRQLAGHPVPLGPQPPDDFSPLPGDALDKAQQPLRARLDQLQREGLELLGQTQSLPSVPLVEWKFDHSREALPTQGKLPFLSSRLHEGAEIRSGRLLLDGKTGFMETDPLDVSLAEKTFEAWVLPAQLHQRGGGVISVETLNGGTFDALVFGEESPREWLAGSENFRRTQRVGGPQETIHAGEESRDWIHMIVVYDAEGGIQLFRNGEPYGRRYVPTGRDGPFRFQADQARILIGKRHTGGGNAFFAGELACVRIFDHALSPEKIRQLHQLGPAGVPREHVLAALPESARLEFDALEDALTTLKQRLQQDFPRHKEATQSRLKSWERFLEAYRSPDNPLHPWAGAWGQSESERAAWWNEWRKKFSDTKQDADTGRLVWDLDGDAARAWFYHGPNPASTEPVPGDFAVEPGGDRILVGLLPPGPASHRLSQKHNGVLTSPVFVVESDWISVLCQGGKGARIRLIPDQYPLGAGNIFPQATITRDTPHWIRLDTAYRRGTRAHLEVTPADEVTARDRSTPPADGRSFFQVQRVVFHDTPQAPPLPHNPLSSAFALLDPGASQSATDWTDHFLNTWQAAIAAWKMGTASRDQVIWLDALIRSGWLSTSLERVPSVQAEVARYRELENDLPIPRRVPGILETVGIDSRLLARGDPVQARDPIPRRYLEVLGSRPYNTSLSGRLELAEEWTHPDNPLTGRVFVNRVWHHVFGQGLVRTVDNFGRLGEEPSHPELLDYLATRWRAPADAGGMGHSLKQLVRFLVTSEAWQRSSQPPAEARDRDPENRLGSHYSVRRLTAEAIRDSFLTISGDLDRRIGGPPINPFAAPEKQRRRSVYLAVHRNRLSPFLEVFDAPIPFTTLGQRDVTTVPAQSLTLLNDPFVRHQAGVWSTRHRTERPDATTEQRIQTMYREAFAREATRGELALCLEYLEQVDGQASDAAHSPAWEELALSLMNLKEWIYLR